jgi:NAD(P)-dependent dehydrogenase (short-subunit alcohol dehydrogenase family)
METASARWTARIGPPRAFGETRSENEDMASLDGKIALVTGASRGLGATTALKLAEGGAALYLAAEGTERELLDVAGACRRINPAGGKVDSGVFDLGVVGAAEEMVETALRAFGRIDVLVNNAAVRCRKPFGEFTQEDYEHLMTVNLRSPFFACQAVLPAMRRNGGGRIINVASQMASIAKQNIALYGISKAALVHLTRSIALEVAKDGIMVNAVSPGPIETEYSTNRLRDQPELRQQMTDDVPMGRFAEPEEIAEVIVFLACSDGAFIHGHDLIVDGGNVIH